MYKSPLVLGVDTNHLKKYPFTLSTSLQAVGDNTGNIIFAEALFNCISGAVRSSYDFTDADLEGRDAIVIAAANWVNDYMEVPAFVQRLEQTKLPISVVGLGAQSQAGDDYPIMLPQQEKLMRLFADRCHSLAVRGEYTAEVLGSYGIKNVVITGCPSMLLMGEEASIRDGSLDAGHITMHGTRYMYSTGYPVQEKLFAAAYQHGHDLVLQSELAEMYFATQRFDDIGNVARAEEALAELYPGHASEEVKEYLRRHAKVFFSLAEWIRYARSRDFIVGSRIHGVVASLLAGTRALLLTHDRRTEELARTMNIPSLPLSEFRRGSIEEMHELFVLADPRVFVDGFKGYRKIFDDYFSSNSLTLRGGGSIQWLS